MLADVIGMPCPDICGNAQRPARPDMMRILPSHKEYLFADGVDGTARVLTAVEALSSRPRGLGLVGPLVGGCSIVGSLTGGTILDRLARHNIPGTWVSVFAALLFIPCTAVALLLITNSRAAAAAQTIHKRLS